MGKEYQSVSNPMVESPYSEYTTGFVSPGESKLISTEDLVPITTEDGVFLITES